MNNQRFFSVGSTFFNLDYVKRFDCDQNRCRLLEANTQAAVVRGASHFSGYDKEHVWTTKKNPEEYQDARRNWLTLKRKHRTQMFNIPMDILEREEGGEPSNNVNNETTEKNN